MTGEVGCVAQKEFTGRADCHVRKPYVTEGGQRLTTWAVGETHKQTGLTSGVKNRVLTERGFLLSPAVKHGCPLLRQVLSGSGPWLLASVWWLVAAFRFHCGAGRLS